MSSLARRVKPRRKILRPKDLLELCLDVSTANNLLVILHGSSSAGIGSVLSIFWTFFGRCFRKNRVMSGVNSFRKLLITSELVLRCVDLMQHSLCQHELCNYVMFLAGDGVHRPKKMNSSRFTFFLLASISFGASFASRVFQARKPPNASALRKNPRIMRILRVPSHFLD